MTSDSSENESAQPPSRLGRFIQTYHSFLSTFVIGAAGLIATSIWQYKQSEISSRQADSQQQIAKTQAENSWRIERAEILSKNLEVLASTGEATVEQRYGVLLSLTRGNILDPELAVSYALELGKDNADYMESVLANTVGKSYARLASAFELTCEQRYGIARDVQICKADAHPARSDAIADLFADETEAARAHGQLGPLELLQDERAVQASPARLAWLFTPYLATMYERRQWNDVRAFEEKSNGARLVAALAVSPQRQNELVAASEATEVDKFHEAHVSWLLGYVLQSSCDPECKGKLSDSLLTLHAQTHGQFDDTLQKLLARPHVEIGGVVSRFHARLLACQLDPSDLPVLRDRVFVPVLAAEAGKDKPDLAKLDDLLSLLALVPEAQPGEASAAPADLQASTAALAKSHDRMGDAPFRRAYSSRRAAADTMRQSPTPALKKALFCNAAEIATSGSEFDSE
ncbi:MAG TPA: hypothetical protein VHZ95_00635 [Polyangiales bacterium]|nr:hypothetical protein [Polyangiales bacterium]